MKKLTILSFLFFSLTSLAQIGPYKDALEKITNSAEYQTHTKNRKKYHVFNEMVAFSKMGIMFQEELEKYNIKVSYGEVSEKDKNKRKRRVNLLSLNQKKQSKLKIFFTEEKQNIFFAELFEANDDNIKYDYRQPSTDSYMFMFEKLEDNTVKLIEVKLIPNH